MTNDEPDLGFFREGEAIPEGWFHVERNHDRAVIGDFVFICDVEASYRDGWLRIQQMRDDEPPYCLTIKDGCDCSYTLLYDIQMFNYDGEKFAEIICDPTGGVIRLA